jgi:hypothetical protein
MIPEHRDKTIPRVLLSEFTCIREERLVSWSWLYGGALARAGEEELGETVLRDGQAGRLQCAREEEAPAVCLCSSAIPSVGGFWEGMVQ